MPLLLLGHNFIDFPSPLASRIFEGRFGPEDKNGEGRREGQKEKGEGMKGEGLSLSSSSPHQPTTPAGKGFSSWPLPSSE
jgi:hypothetical protein